MKLEGEAAGGLIEIIAGRNDVDLKCLHVGDRIWKTNDPHLDKGCANHSKMIGLTVPFR